jgi:hypothetical protein
MKCDVCGKEMSISTKHGISSIAGMTFNIHIESSEDISTLQDQYGPYEIRDYHICIECWLRKAGIKATLKPMPRYTNILPNPLEDVMKLSDGQHTFLYVKKDMIK